MKSFFSDDDFICTGREWVLSNLIYEFNFIPKIILKKKGMLYLMKKHFEKGGSQFFTCIEYQTIPLGHNSVRHTVLLKSGYEFCREFFLIAKGTMETFFELMGATSVSVNLEWLDRGATLELYCKFKKSLLDKLRIYILKLLVSKEFTNELD